MPQYTIRLLSDVMLVSPAIADEVVIHLQSTGCIVHLLRLLKIRRISSNDEDVEPSSSSMVNCYPDPQVVVLLRYVFERNGAVALLQCDVATAIASVCISIIYGKLGTYINYSSNELITKPSSSSLVSTMLDIDLEDLMVSIDLLHLILHFVIRALSTADEKDRIAMANNAKNNITSSPSRIATTTIGLGQNYAQAEGYRRQIAPLRAVSPALLVMLHCAHLCIVCHKARLLNKNVAHVEENHISNNHNDSSRIDEVPATSHVDMSSYLHLLDSGSRCLGILFDLYPNDVSMQLSSRQPLTLDSLHPNATTIINTNHPTSGNLTAVAARDVLSTLITSSYVSALHYDDDSHVCLYAYTMNMYPWVGCVML